jgi:hypothetical protein
MSFKMLANRLLPPTYRHPDPPVAAAQSAPSFLLSVDDDVRPTARLVRLALDAIEAAMERVSFSDQLPRPNLPPQFDTWPGENYRLLAAMVMVLEPKCVVEIGTRTGLATVALKQHLPPGSRLDSFSPHPWNIPGTVLTPQDLNEGRLAHHVVDLADPATFARHSELLAGTDFLYVAPPPDPSPQHPDAPAPMPAVLAHLRDLEFRSRPIIFVDDTRLWHMLAAQRHLPWPKLDLTSFGHWTGATIFEP